MKYLKIILFWISLSIIAGLIIKFFVYEEMAIGFFIIFLCIGLMLGSLRASLSFYGSRSKMNIFSEVIKMYNGKRNFKGEPEIVIKNRKIILGYKLEHVGNRVAEYLIANIDLTNVEKSQINNCKKHFEIVESKKNIYAIVYCSWGYKGDAFKKRIKKKIDQINDCLKL